MAATTRDIEIMRNAYQKLDGMVLSFGIPSYSDALADGDVSKVFYIDLKDTLREIGMQNCDGIAVMSMDEMRIENRVVYHALRRFRNSASVFFKFSTSSDGKSVDKSMIPKMLAQMITEYDNDFKSWRKVGAVWSVTPSVSTNGDYSTS